MFRAWEEGGGLPYFQAGVAIQSVLSVCIPLRMLFAMPGMAFR
ncbi:MAG: hypothetical protein ACPGAC_05660 [Candidatus Puniceispirillaceae bacterium]